MTRQAAEKEIDESATQIVADFFYGKYDKFTVKEAREKLCEEHGTAAMERLREWVGRS